MQIFKSELTEKQKSFYIEQPENSSDESYKELIREA